MKILTIIWIILIIFSIMVPAIIMFVENNFEENHPFMKWWRKHVVGYDPKDDIYK